MKILIGFDDLKQDEEIFMNNKMVDLNSFLSCDLLENKWEIGDKL